MISTQTKPNNKYIEIKINMKKLLLVAAIGSLALASCNPTQAFKYTDEYVFVGYYKKDSFVVKDTAAFLQPDSTWKMKPEYAGQIKIIK
jgi:NADH:ubiquinone oxidoreductase subunit 5 (subunit L)/multisubunit Na+/H+ antiporter MnhA subunit